MAEGNGKGPTLNEQIAHSIRQLDALTLNLFTARSEWLKRQMDPRRDLDEECGYPREISREQYKRMWDRSGVAKRATKLWPSECWAVDPEVYEEEQSETETEFEVSWKAHLKRLNIWHWLERVDVLSGIGHYGVLFVGFDDGKELSEPVEGVEEWFRKRALGEEDEKAEAPEPVEPTEPEEPPVEGEEPAEPQAPPVYKGKHRVMYLRAFEESLCQISKLDDDPTSPRFGQPVLYNITFGDPAAAAEGNTAIADTTSKPVHWTRVLHVADNRESSEVFGVPRMKPIYNNLHNIQKILGGGGEMFYRGGFPGISIETHPSIENPEINMEETREQLFYYMNTMQRFLINQGTTAKSLAPQIADPKSHLMVQLQEISIAMECPFRIFLGSEEAKLAGGQDVENWLRRVKRRQDKNCTPYQIRAYIDLMLASDVLPEPAEYFVEWPDLNEPNATDKANVSNTKATAMGTYVSLGIESIMAPMEFLTMVMGFTLEEAEAIVQGAEDNIEASVEREAATHDLKVEAGLEMDIEDEQNMALEQKDQDFQQKKALIQEQGKVKQKLQKPKGSGK